MPQTSTNNKQRKQYSKKEKTLIYVVVFSVLILGWDFTIGGNIGFYTKWVECGHKPLEGARDFGSLRYYREARNYPMLARPSSLFCTPRDAELSGYSGDPNVWQDNHLSNAEALCVSPMTDAPGVTDEQIYQTCKDK